MVFISDPELSQFLYISHIAGPRAFETVSAIVAQARPLNQQRGITGLLVFDGAQVCQYFEGKTAEVDTLAARLIEDDRHDRVQVLHQGPLSGSRRFARWRLGYLNLDPGRDLSLFHSVSGEEAVQALLDLFPAIDQEP